MDPITVAALSALAGSVAGDVGHQAWQGLSALVRRPFRRGSAGDALSGESSGVSSGELEVAELGNDPADPVRAQALATALGVRAALDEEFRALLQQWWEDARSGSGAEVQNSVSGGTQNGPVIQGRDFSSITFDMSKNNGS
ncbi:hypothetical protein R6L23_26280 [Streptomyces sp. SR27]|uniref:hypothetical protein n=1 Tax=unclassified Streptomyces TaxID=2593676 RepID=UPI00295ACF23|nr:hypothetical protein [Streptomyces sp. SR27]MDV9191675.1 hypothetical protein [Streptomyces sp. SR27]